jgi:hypothetical protein
MRGILNMNCAGQERVWFGSSSENYMWVAEKNVIKEF